MKYRTLLLQSELRGKCVQESLSGDIFSAALWLQQWHGIYGGRRLNVQNL
jgi:hypothetical protein